MPIEMPVWRASESSAVRSDPAGMAIARSGPVRAASAWAGTLDMDDAISAAHA